MFLREYRANKSASLPKLMSSALIFIPCVVAAFTIVVDKNMTLFLKFENYSKLCICLTLLFCPVIISEFLLNPVVKTTHGRLRGSVGKSRDGRIYFSFQGIPFAKPPVGDLRLEPPEPIPAWSGIKSALNESPTCIQLDILETGRIKGQEDCLCLNVFTPKKPQSSGPLLPVIFFIHGGHLVSGETSIYGPQYFMDHDVVVVTVNYRLGMFGFFSTGDGLLEGNQGLKDQNMGLRWLKDNAAQFGGDPNRITLMGESAGGISVYYHILSPLSQGLFHRAILNSGTPFGNAGFQGRTKEQRDHLGRRADCPVDDSQILIECLKGKEPEVLAQLSTALMTPFHADVSEFSATVEVTNKATTFLPADPNEILASGKFAKVPIMVGVNSADGGVITAQLKGNDLLEYLDSQWEVYAPLTAFYNSTRIDTSKSLKSYFLPNGEIPSENLYNLTRFFSLSSFWEDAHYVAKLHSQFAPVHLFYYNYISDKLLNLYFLLRNVRAESPLWPLTLAEAVIENYVTKLFPNKDPNQLGAMHAADLPITWKIAPIVMEVKPWSKDYPFSKQFVKAMVDFAYGSEPLRFNGTLWDQVDPREVLCYMEMKNVASRMIEEPFKEEVAFFQRLGIRKRISLN